MAPVTAPSAVTPRGDHDASSDPGREFHPLAVWVIFVSGVKMDSTTETADVWTKKLGDQNPPDMMRAALWYARKGWYVLPVWWAREDGTCACGKPSGQCKTGKHPIHKAWHENATCDDATIITWWLDHPHANIGIHTGKSGLVALDADDAEAWTNLVAKHGHALEETICAITGSGGKHFVYAANGHKFSTSTGDLPKGIDVRGGNSQIIVAPSVHPSGNRYCWAEGHGPQEQDPAPIPEDIADRILKRKRAKRGQGCDEVPADVLKAYRGKEGYDQGVESWGYCPWCTDQILGESSLNRNTGAFHCFGCEQSGGWRDLAAKLGIEVTSKTGLPEVNAGEQRLRVVSGQAWGAIKAANTPPRLFRHAGRAVRLETDENDPVLAVLAIDQLRYEAARAADWYANKRIAEDEFVRVAAKPPVGVIRDMLAYPAEAIPLPRLERIARAPIFSSDGSLLTTAGFHETARVYISLASDLKASPIPTNPSSADIARAVALVDDLIVDFPLVGDADRAHSFALLILPFVRDLIDGPTPLHLIEAPIAGSGKGLLASVLLIPATGDDVGTMAAGGDDEEWRKRLTTVLQAGASAVLIDNVRSSIESAELSRALTSRRWSDRRLGGNELLSLPVRCAWVATGNNPMLSTEIARRCVRVRLDAKRERPWQRPPSDFRHDPLLSWAHDQRGELVGAALTLCQAWLAAGRPRAKTPPIGSFESWAQVIGGILAHAGIAGFLTNLDELYERADSEGAIWRRFVGAWWDTHETNPVGVAQLFTIAEAMDEFDFGRATTERGQKTVLGKELKSKEDMIIGGRRIMTAGIYKRKEQFRLAQAHTDGAGGALGALGAHSPPPSDLQTDYTGPGKSAPSAPSAPTDDFEDF